MRPPVTGGVCGEVGRRLLWAWAVSKEMETGFASMQLLMTCSHISWPAGQTLHLMGVSKPQAPKV